MKPPVYHTAALPPPHVKGHLIKHPKNVDTPDTILIVINAYMTSKGFRSKLDKLMQSIFF